MDKSLGGLFPTRWFVPGMPTWYEQQIIVNWLEVEITENPEEEMPSLQELKGWRNREVYEYVKHQDVTKYVGAVYGLDNLIANVHFENGRYL